MESVVADYVVCLNRGQKRSNTTLATHYPRDRSWCGRGIREAIVVSFCTNLRLSTTMECRCIRISVVTPRCLFFCVRFLHMFSVRTRLPFRSIYIPSLPDSADKDAVRNLFSGIMESQRYFCERTYTRYFCQRAYTSVFSCCVCRANVEGCTSLLL